jgi:hypothetical protein
VAGAQDELRVETLTESRPVTLAISDDEAERLQRAGRRLASRKTWWGGIEADPAERSVIDCRRVSNDHWSVLVRDAVGIVCVGQVQLVIQPKIPLEHLVYLLSAAGHLPRMDEERGKIGHGPSLWHLVSRWFVSAAERVLRRDLLRDYCEHSDFLRTKRGRVVPLPTARSYYSGRIGFECRYEEFTVDTPLNRLVKAAASAVLVSPVLPPELRRRARAVCARMADVGEVQVADLGVSIERRAAYYTDAVHLARHVLRGTGRVLAAGEHAAWTFLFRTPEAVEEGLRALLQAQLCEYWTVTKRGIGVGAGLTFTPDLVLDEGRAVADVKYKLLQREWVRSDLYQIVAFGTAFQADFAAIVCFRSPELQVAPPLVTVGGTPVSCLAWIADPSMSAHEAATELVGEVRAWMSRAGASAHRDHQDRAIMIG